MKRVGVYLRVSTEEQARIQDGSLVSQRQRIIEYVDGQNRRTPNWGLVVDFYLEEGKSAKDMNRPEFQRMLHDVRTGRINLIVATELSRLSRSLKDFCEVWDLFKQHSTGFITLREQFDTTTAAGEMMVFKLSSRVTRVNSLRTAGDKEGGTIRSLASNSRPQSQALK